jgi:hypothetical protein
MPAEGMPMTQPPDPAEPQPSEPTAPLEPPVPSAPVTPSTDDQPTVAWTPTDPAGSSSEPATPAPVPDAADTPASPIISAAPLAGAAGASGAPFASADPAAPAAPGAPPPAAADAPLVGWTPPGPAAPVATSDGFVLAGVGARFVAFLLDAVVVAIVPGILMILVSDFSGIADAIRAGRSAGSAAVATPVTMQSVLIELIGLGINFLYFVGLWTSGWRATLGQRLLSIQVADAATGHGLSLAAASKRWLAFGAPLNLLAFVPAPPAMPACSPSAWPSSC